MLFAGLDSGSRTLKGVLWDEDAGRVAASGVVDQGLEQEALAAGLLDDLLSRVGRARDDVARTVATGYGRNLLGFAATTVTEITCHARGVSHLAPGTRTVIDVGGQDSKLIHLDERGATRDFVMNDRCAAGTGRFLEMVAERLDISLADFGERAGRSVRPATISNMCAVFAETEIVGLLASGAALDDIVAGAQVSIARRVASMAGPRVEAPIVFTGGVALIAGMKEALESALGRPVAVADEPQLTGATGAALIAAKT